MRKGLSFLVMLLVSILTTTSFAQDELTRVPVFTMGESGSQYYRIPAIVETANGTLVAIADQRGSELGDLPNIISIVAKTSSDKGASWSSIKTIAQGVATAGTTYGDAAAVYDSETGKIITVFVGNENYGSNTVGIWASNSSYPLRLYKSESSDNGESWTTPVDISSSIYNGIYGSSYNWIGMFAGSGSALQLKKGANAGRLMFVVAARNNSTWGGTMSNYAVYSDDNGATWQVSSNAACTNGDEAKVVELENGDILMSIKNRNKGSRLMAKSTDGGATWTTATANANLNDPACNGDLVSYETSDGKHYLLHSMPASTTTRENVTVYLSTDGGETWPISRQIYSGYSAYSALEVLNDGTIGIIVEEGKWDSNLPGSDGFNLAYYNFTLDWLLEGVDFDAIELIDSAKELITKTGIGYPNATAREALQSAIDAAEEDTSAENVVALQSAIDNYYTTEDIERPTVGKAYAFISKGMTADYYMYNNNGTLTLASYTEGTELPSTAKFICEYDDITGKYMFKTFDGAYYLAYPTIGGKSWLDNESATGLEATVSNVTKFNIQKISLAENVTATAQDLFGYVRMWGYRGYDNTKNVDSEGPIIVKSSAGTFDGASSDYYNANFSSAFQIKPVSKGANPSAIDRTNWEATASSYEYDGEGVAGGWPKHTIDGVTSTFWHSDYSVSPIPSAPHWLQYNIGAIYEITAFNYVSRNEQSANIECNGNVKTYKLYVSNSDISANLDPATYEPVGLTPVSEGEFVYDGTSAEHPVELPEPAEGQYVFLLITDSYNSDKNTKFGNCAEFYLTGAPLGDACVVSVSVNPAEAGSATVNGAETAEVIENSKVTLSATPATAYKFANWTLNGEVVSTENPYKADVTADAEFVANFAVKELVSVSVSVNDDTMGSVISSVEGQIYEGSEVTLTATPAEGYMLESWTVNGEVVSTANPFTTTVTATTEFVANFKEKPNKITIASIECSEVAWSSFVIEKAIDNDYSTNYESNSYPSNGTTVTATFDTNKVLDKVVVYFSGSSVPAQGKFQISADGLTWTDIEGSTFTSSQKDSNNAITVDCKKVVAKYLRLNIVQVALAYLKIYEFEVYGKDLSVGERTISVSVNDATMGTAYIGEEGVTEVADSADPLQLVAVANEGYEFINWTVDGEVVSTSATIYDTTEGDKAYVANFIPLAQCTVSVSVNDAMMGSATASQTGEMFKYTEVTFEATANEGYEFVNWTIGDSIVSKSSTFKTVIKESAEYKANFRVTPTKLALEDVFASFTLSTLPNIIDGRMSSESYKQLNANGETVTVVLENESAIGDIALYFYNNISYQPSKAKIQVSSDNETYTDVEGCSFIQSDLEGGVIVLDAKGVSAKYVRLVLEETSWFDMWEFEVYEAPVNVAPRQISVSVNDASMGTAYVGTESITSVSNQTGAVKIVATATENAYRFVNWTLNGEVVETSATFFDRTEGDKAYVANFEAKPIYTVGVSSATAKRGSATCDAAEVVYEGDVVTFTATPTDGYGFISWTVNGEVVSTENPYVLEITESVDLVANFDVDPELDRSSWSVYTVSSEYAGLDGGQYVKGDKAIDGNTSTYWHTDWDNAANKKVPQWIVFNLGSVKSFDSFNYLSRSESANANGNISGYQIYVSNEAPSLDDLTGSMTMINEGTFTYPGQEHKVDLGKAYSGQYVMLYATATNGEGGANLFANCAEFYLYMNAYSVSVSASNEAQGYVYIGEEGITSVDCSVEGTDVVTITAVPAEGYQFVNWTLEGEVVSTEAEYTTTAVTEGRDYVANFEFAPVAPRTITAAVNNAAKGSVVFLAPASTETSVVSDSIVVMEAVPATTDDFFVNWTINGVEVSTETTYEYLGAADVTIQANFISKYIVTVEPNEDGIITVKQGEAPIASGDRVLEGEEITITVKANVRHELKELYVNGENVFAQYKAAGSYTLAVTEEVTISAVYGDPICYFTYECTGNGGWIEAYESDSYDETAFEEGTLELPLQPVGYQYAYGEEVPFLSTLAIFPVTGARGVLISLSINGEDIDVSEESDIIFYGDYFIDEVEGPVHVIAEFIELSGVEDAEATETNVYAVAGGIVVEVAETATASIYSIAGVLVSEQTVSEKATIAMEKGVYIVKVADKVAKVIVK